MEIAAVSVRPIHHGCDGYLGVVFKSHGMDASLICVLSVTDASIAAIPEKDHGISIDALIAKGATQNVTPL